MKALPCPRFEIIRQYAPLMPLPCGDNISNQRTTAESHHKGLPHKMEPMPAVTGGKAGYTLDRSPVHHRAEFH
ncbi:hypothetical protein AOLI_G00234650 [Acnodon oligacanthus]